MVTVVTREANGIPLTHQQVDDNFTGLATAINSIGADVIAEAVVAKDIAVGAANAANASSVSASNSANAASISSGSAATSAEQASVSAAASAASATLSASYVVNLMSSAGTTFIGFMADGIGAVMRRLFDKLLETISIKDYGAVSDGTTNDAAAIVKANTRAGKRPLVFIGVSHVGTPITITAPIADTMEQIFTANSQITIDNGLPVRPEWFGMAAGNIRRAVDCLPYPAGGIVQLSKKVYPPSYSTATASMFDNRGGTPGVDYMVKPNVRIQGAVLPKFIVDNSGLQEGSIIQGPFYVTSECFGFSVDKIGVDSGANVVSALYPGNTNVDAFCFLQVNKSAPIYARGCTVGDIVGIGGGPANQCHAILIEAMDGDTIGTLEGRQAFHGVVVKSKNIVGGRAIGKGSNGECVIFKSDDYAVMKNVKFDSVSGIGLNAGELGFGFLIQAAAADGQGVQVANVYVESKALGMASQGNGVSHALVDVQIGNVMSQSCGAGYCVLAGADRVQAGNVIVNASTDAVYVDQFTLGKANSIANLAITVATNGINSYGKISVGDVAFDQISGKAIKHSTPQARVRISSRVNTGIGFSNDWDLQPSLAGTWANQGGGEPFSLTLDHGKVVMSGLVGGGADTLLIAALDARIRPPVNLRFNCIGFNGTVRASVEVLVTTDGAVYATPLSATANNLSLQGVAWDVPF